jgi:hypothetical protein
MKILIHYWWMILALLGMARGVGAHGGGSYDASAQQDILDGDSLQGPNTQLFGSADVINPHVSACYLIERAGVDAMTLGAPTAGADDNLSLTFISDTANAHTLTCPSTIIATGSSVLRTVATFAAFRGATLSLRAFNGLWYVVGNNGPVTFA